jgi:hypothetical protein
MISLIERSPKRYARIAGVLYLIIIASGLFAEAFVRSRLIVPSNAAATAANIAAHGTLLRVGIAADLATFVLAIPVTLILYVLLKPVHKDLALLAVFFNIVQDAIGGVNALNTYRPLQLLGGADYLNVFSQEQLAAMASMSLRTHAVGFAIGLLFFGVYCIVLGYLVRNSRLFPKVLGILFGIAGVCYLINSLAVILSPTLSAILFPTILLPAFVGELAFALWLTAKGVDASKWIDVANHINPSTQTLGAPR